METVHCEGDVSKGNGNCTSHESTNMDPITLTLDLDTSAEGNNLKRKNPSLLFDPDEMAISLECNYSYVENECKRQKLDFQVTMSRNTKGNCLQQLYSSIKSKHSKENIKPTTAVNPLQSKYENIHTTTVKKLTTFADQLRHEIGTLKAALATEQNTVRILR